MQRLQETVTHAPVLKEPGACEADILMIKKFNNQDYSDKSTWVDVNSDEYKASRAKVIEEMMREKSLAELDAIAGNPRMSSDVIIAAVDELLRRKSLPNYKFMS
jgi:hypothetical protein